MAAILRAALSVSAATVLSRASGYLRWGTQAAVLGGGIVADAYTASLLLPGLIYELFMGGILYSIFIPVLVDRMTKEGEEDARGLTNVLFTLVMPLMALLALVGIVFAGPLVAFATNWQASQNLSPAEAQQTLDLAVLFFRIFALQMLFYGVSTIATGVLQAHRRFFLPTFAPVLNNFVVIGSFGAYWLLKDTTWTAATYVLAFGVTLGVAVMALALVPTMLPWLQATPAAAPSGPVADRPARRTDGRAGGRLRRVSSVRGLSRHRLRGPRGAQLRVHRSSLCPTASSSSPSRRP